MDPGVLALFAVGFVSVTAAVGIGYLAGIDPVFIAIFAGLGGMTSNVLIVIFGDRIRSWIRRKRGKGDQEPKAAPSSDNWRSRLSHAVTEKYGAPGLGLVAAPIIGPPLSTATGLAFGISRRDLLIWMSLGNITWAIVMTVLVAIGFVAASQIA